MQETATGFRIVNDATEAESPTPEKARYAFPPRNGILHVIISVLSSAFRRYKSRIPVEGKLPEQYFPPYNIYINLIKNANKK